MDYATAMKIVVWAANEYHWLRCTGIAPSRGTPYTPDEVEEAVSYLREYPIDVGAYRLYEETGDERLRTVM